MKKVVGDWKKVDKDLRWAVKQTVTHVKSQVAKEISSRINVKQKDVKRKLKVRMNPNDPTATVILNKEARPGVNIFGAKQNQTGVTYKIGKESVHVLGAFQGPRPGVMKLSWKGNAFKRQSKARLKIVKLQGPSLWGVFVKNNSTEPVVASARVYMKKQLRNRIKYRIAKARGEI